MQYRTYEDKGITLPFKISNALMRNLYLVVFLITIQSLACPFKLAAQELEPRALTNLPRGLNFAAIGYAHASGNILLDPAIPLEDFNGSINTIVLAYVKSVNFFGASGKVDVILPFAGGDFTGVFEDEAFTDAYTGFGDLRVRATINLTGAPSLAPSDFKAYEQKTISGLGVQVFVPIGKYNKEQLPNLGSNRWSLRVNYGLSHTFDRWLIEAHAGIWLFSPNNNLLGDNKQEQKPLWIAKGNIIRNLGKKGMWLAFSAGFGYGGEASVNDVRIEATISQMRLGLTYALPLSTKNALKFTVGSGIRFKQGSDFDIFGVTFSHLWLGSKRAKTPKNQPKE
jgi:hypothetical protein